MIEDNLGFLTSGKIKATDGEEMFSVQITNKN